MAITKVGIVYYADDHNKAVFRIVFPEFDDSELDGPPTDGNRRVMQDDNGKPHTWTSFGTDPSRVAVMEKVPAGSPRAVLTGMP